MHYEVKCFFFWVMYGLGWIEKNHKKPETHGWKSGFRFFA